MAKYYENSNSFSGGIYNTVSGSKSGSYERNTIEPIAYSDFASASNGTAFDSLYIQASSGPTIVGDEKNQMMAELKKVEDSGTLEKEPFVDNQASDVTTNVEPTDDQVSDATTNVEPTDNQVAAVYDQYSDTGSSINVSFGNVEEDVKILYEASTKMQDAWNEIKNNILGQIGSSWAGKDCQAYLDKISGMDSKMQSSFEALDLLAKTYDNAKNQIAEKQSEMVSIIENI